MSRKKVSIQLILEKSKAAIGIFIVSCSLLLCAYLLVRLGGAIKFAWSMCEVDLLYSAKPLIDWHFSEGTSWFCSIFSSVAQLLLPFFAVNFKKAVNEKIVEFDFPLFGGRETAKGFILFVWVMNVFDFGTNIFGAWPNTGTPETPFFQHLIVTLIEAFILTFSELLLVLNLALLILSLFVGYLAVKYIFAHVSELFSTPPDEDEQGKENIPSSRGFEMER